MTSSRADVLGTGEFGTSYPANIIGMASWITLLFVKAACDEELGLVHTLWVPCGVPHALIS